MAAAVGFVSNEILKDPPSIYIETGQFRNDWLVKKEPLPPDDVTITHSGRHDSCFSSAYSLQRVGREVGRRAKRRGEQQLQKRNRRNQVA